MYIFDVIYAGDVVAAAQQLGLDAEFDRGYTHVFVKSNDKHQAAGRCQLLACEVIYVCCLETLW